MFEKEEERLTEYKKIIDQMDIPMALLDDAILAGVQKAKLEEKKNSNVRTRLLGIAAAAVLVIGFFTSVRLSPAFADYLTNIPGMEKVVDLIRHDQGKLLAVQNDYYEKIGASQEKNGMKLTVNGMIADENGMVLFYTLYSTQEDPLIEKANIESLDGERLSEFSSSYSSPGKSGQRKNEYTGTVEYYYDKDLKAKNFKINVTVTVAKGRETFSIPFKRTMEIKPSKTYEVNKTVTIEGQKITILDVKISPLRAAIHVKMDPNNTKRILNFDDLRLVDENGSTWNKINNGETAKLISKDESLIYLQSNYFRNPQKLYLVINTIQAVDKDEVNVVVDTQKGQILKQPKGNIISKVWGEGNDIIFTYQTKKPFPYFQFGNITDGKGKTIDQEFTSSQGLEGKGPSELIVTVPNLKKQINPLSFEIAFFPSWIHGHEKVRIK